MSKNKTHQDPRILQEEAALVRYNEIKEKGLLIFEAIVGSQSYGTNLPTSDVDKKFVYIETMDNILSGNASIQLNINKDYTGYELGRYLDLLRTQNPTIIELLHADEKFVEFCHPLFRELLINNRDQFLSKQVAYSFGEYAKSQINKAQGTNKKFMNPMDGPRKSLLEFAWVPYKNGSISLKEYLDMYLIPEEWVGLSGIDHMRYTFYMFVDPVYYDIRQEAVKKVRKGRAFWRNLLVLDYNKKEKEQYVQNIKDGIWNFLGGDPGGYVNGVMTNFAYTSKFNGPVDVDGVQPKLSSIPKGLRAECIVQFNMDGFQKYCDDYREYHEWLEKRNLQRFVENSSSEHNYDRKNMMHCHRLLDMCLEILRGENVKVLRPNRDELLGIRNGDFTYKELVDRAMEKSETVKKLYETSTLPETCDKSLTDSILLDFRRRFYNIS